MGNGSGPEQRGRDQGQPADRTPALSLGVRQGRACPRLTGASWAVDPTHSKAPFLQGQAPGSSEGHLGCGLG